MALDLTTLKAHCNVTGAADDAVLTRLLTAATKHTQSVLGFTLADMEGGAPEDLEQAVYMLAAHWYENREATLVGVSAQSVPMGFDAIISEHRNYTFGETDDE